MRPSSSIATSPSLDVSAMSLVISLRAVCPENCTTPIAMAKRKNTPAMAKKARRPRIISCACSMARKRRERVAPTRVPPEERDALAFAAKRIEAFHRALLPKDVDFTDGTGTRLGARYRPVDAAGVYVPGGTAAYPSSVLMNIVPAKVAGVRRIVMAVPTPQGVLNPLVMMAATIAG